ncbi:chemotaxis protein [Streptomyces liangshanensis]|uniref:Chemotaxis protein n=1 Tax=Streptomyces liangshanensis TaxID=2717324 RepID=A0A6G9H8M4_9ACTN|nr:chemotaxis protein [Streptomyces liangshanensis]QIQ06447.1 chemotaxis protein [Streptomyces liangshanensis]
MDHNALTPDVLRELRTPRPYPAVSLTMPTHRRDPYHDQDTVRLRNLLAEAWRRLEEEPGLDRAARTAVKSRIGRAVAEVDLRRTLDGLLILADTLDYRIWYLPREVPEQVVVSDTYLTRNLVAATAQSRPYWVLSVAADRATLWDGSGDTLDERHDDGFPMSPPRDTWDPEREERVGDPGAFRDEETRQFLRSVDRATASVLARHPRPLYVVGLAPALALLEDAGSATHGAAGRLVKGGLAEGPASVLRREIGPVRDAHDRREQRELFDKLDAAKGRRAFAAGLDEVWESVRERRAEVIAVEDHYRQSVRISEGHLVPVEGRDGQGPGVRVQDDIVDELVESALDGGAEVVFLPDDALAGQERIAAVLRY